MTCQVPLEFAGLTPMSPKFASRSMDGYRPATAAFLLCSALCTCATGVAPNAVRGQLISVATPRAAVLGLQAVTPVGSFY